MFQTYMYGRCVHMINSGGHCKACLLPAFIALPLLLLPLPRCNKEVETMQKRQHGGEENGGLQIFGGIQTHYSPAPPFSFSNLGSGSSQDGCTAA